MLIVFGSILMIFEEFYIVSQGCTVRRDGIYKQNIRLIKTLCNLNFAFAVARRKKLDQSQTPANEFFKSQDEFRLIVE